MDALYFIQVQNSSMSGLTPLQRGALYARAPTLSEFWNADRDSFLLPRHDAIEHDTVDWLVNRLLQDVGEGDVRSFLCASLLDHILAIRIHCTLSLFGLNEEAEVVQKEMEDLFRMKKATLDGVQWVWEVVGSTKHLADNLPQWPNGLHVAPFSADYLLLSRFGSFSCLTCSGT